MAKNNRFIFFIALLLLAVAFPVFAQDALPSSPTEPKRVLVQEVSLPEPSISISPDIFYPLDDILYIEGRGVPDSTVNVVLQKQGEQPIKFTVKTDSFGEWAVSEKTYLSSGNWEIRARQQVKNEISDWSNPRVIRSVVTGVNILGFNIRYVVITIILLVFFAIVASIFIFFIKKINRLKHGLLEKQLHETEERFHENISEIRRDLMGELQALVANASSRPLTPEELQKRDHILEQLDSLEKNMEHNIQDIGRKI